MTQLMDLHMAQSLADLQIHFALPAKINLFKIDSIVATATKVLQDAKKASQIRDEEMAYIKFMKYIALITYMQKREDFKSNKDYYQRLIGRNNTQFALISAENLSKSLERRYDILKAIDKAADNRQKEHLNDINMDNNNGHDNNDNESNNNVISVKELFNWINDKAIGLLIIDCRSMDEYQQSHLLFSYCCHVPESIICPGSTAGKIHNELSSQEMKNLWSSRSIKDNIILMDTNSKVDSMINQPILNLLNILQNWDPDVKYKKPILLLNGGYNNFVLHYPMLTSCSDITLHQTPINISFDIDTIEYPSTDGIEMKENIIKNLKNNRPVIDRSSKESAIKALEEREKLAEKVIDVSKTTLAAETKLSELQSLDRDALDVGERLQYDKQIQTLLYELMQYKVKYKDLELQVKDLEGQIRLQKTIPNEPEQGQVINDKFAKILEIEAEQRIKQKNLEERAIFEKAKDLEKKRSLKEIENIPAKRVQPTIDRTVKPQPRKKIIPFADEIIYRDFSPERGSRGQGLTGLKNLGNTCYMNSIMQCLSNTHLLVEYLTTDVYKEHLNRSNETQGKIADELSAVLREIWCDKYRYISSKNFRKIVGEFHQLFRGMAQQDSHEFLTILIDWLHSDLQITDQQHNMKTRQQQRISPSDKAWQEFVKNKKSKILELFYGQIKSTVKCKTCLTESATYESFSNLSLELVDIDRCHVIDCMKMYFSGEQINGWNCPKCKTKRSAIKVLNISKLPTILVIHLKRFYAANDASYKKNQVFVEFPLTNLDIEPFLAPSYEQRDKENFNYNLYGISNHYGHMDRGHYTAFCKSPIYSRWYKYDDQTVLDLDPSDVQSGAAYILFYSRSR